MLNPAFFLEAAARRDAGGEACVFDGRRFTFGDLDRLSNRCANALVAAGIQPGDRVALLCSNRPTFVVAAYGALKAGAELVLLSTTLKPRDIAFQLADSEAKLLFLYDGHGDCAIALQTLAVVPEDVAVVILPPSPEKQWRLAGHPSLGLFCAPARDRFETRWRTADATQLILYTSGSTGRPKGVQITAANIAAMVMINLPLSRAGVTRRKLVATPLYHILGQVFCLHLSMFTGDCMVLVDHFEPQRVWRLMEREAITHFVHMPIYYKYLLDAARGVDDVRIRSHLRLCATGSSPLPPAWSEAFRDRFGQPIVPGYGMTEASTIVTWHSPEDALRIETVGRVVPGVNVELRNPDGAPVQSGEEGEIWVRSPGVMKGYLNLPDATKDVLVDGWYRTRDLGAFDDAGYLTIKGRADTKIKRGEEHIYPAEIETVLLEHPLVAQAAVIAVPHETLGEEAKTFVVPVRPGALNEANLLAWLERELPAGKAPGLIQFRDQLPTTTLGKIARHELV